jgi:hypothetical protein
MVEMTIREGALGIPTSGASRGRSGIKRPLLAQELLISRDEQSSNSSRGETDESTTTNLWHLSHTTIDSRLAANLLTISFTLGG